MTAVRRSAALAVIGLLLALPVVATALQARSGTELHAARVGVAAPTVVGQAVSDAASSLAGDPVELVPIATRLIHVAAAREAGRRAVADGTFDAVVVLDLRTTHDTLLVTTTRTDPYVDALRAQLDRISEGFGRTLRVEYVEPDAAVTSSWAPGALAGVWCGIGVLVAVAATIIRGRVAGGRHGSTRRLVGLLLVAVATGLATALAVGHASVSLIAPACATVAVTGLLVLAAESALGLPGIGIAVGLMVAPTIPVVTGITPDLLADPWYSVDRIAPQTAAWQLARVALGHTEGGAGSWAVLAAWGLTAVVALATAQAMRPHEVSAES